MLGVGDLDAGDGGGDLEFDGGEFVGLAGLEREIGSGPGFKALGRDDEGEVAGFDVVEFEGAGAVSGDGAIDAGRSVFEGDGGGGDVGAVGVLDDADDRAGRLRIEGGWQRGGWERARRDGDVGGWSVWEGDFVNAEMTGRTRAD